MAEYMRDWLARRAGPASDLDLAVLLLNSMDYLADPPDRLSSVTWFRDVAAHAGRADIAGALVDADLPGLRRLRDSLRAAFEAGSADDVAAQLNPLLARAPSVPQLVVSGDTLRLEVAPGERGLAALIARLPAAVATHVAQHGIGRLGTCAALPCRCAFVDYTRGGTRRFCCTACNDRAAAKLYRQRKRQA